MGRLLLPLLAALLSLNLASVSSQAEQPPAYVALGNSLAFGVGASDPSTGGYVRFAYDALRLSDRYRDSGLELVNLSAPGATSSDLLVEGGQLDDALAEIALRGSSSGGVEIVSLDIGGNDVFALGDPGSPCLNDPLGDACTQVFADALDGLDGNVREVVSRLREAAPEADIVIVGFYNPYSGTGEEFEIPAELAVDQINKVLGDVASDTDLEVKYAEVFDYFTGRGAQWVADDRLHPNDDGHFVISEILLATIQGRDPVIPEDLLAVPAGPAPDIPPDLRDGAQDRLPDGGGFNYTLLAVALIGGVVALAAVAGGYIFARGRA
jgi:lysophospholipase L1-like esterase